MKAAWLRRGLYLPLILATLSAAAAVCFLPNLRPFQNPTGAVATFSAGGDINRQNAFFQSLGTNGRTCATCHQPAQAFGLSADGAQAVYRRTRGRDPLFAAIDGANCPTTVSGDRAAHSLLLERGLFRIALPVPENAEFTIEVVHDPYGCAITTDPATGHPVISVYRRPQPATNLRFLSAVMFDGRETVMPLNNAQTYASNLYQDLTHQAIDAIEGHAQAAGPPSATKVDEIVRFESGASGFLSRPPVPVQFLFSITIRNTIGPDCAWLARAEMGTSDATARTAAARVVVIFMRYLLGNQGIANEAITQCNNASILRTQN